MNRRILGCIWAALLFASCSGSSPEPVSTTPAAGDATNAAATYTATATATVLPRGSGPVVKTYARGDTVDVLRGTLFLDPATGGGEAWADVGVSPQGTFAKWNGPDGTEPPVLFETITRRRIELDTGGRPGTILDFNKDESETSIRVGDELRIASTNDGKVRVTLPIPQGATHVRAYWGVDGAVAMAATSPQGQTSLGVTVWWRRSLRTFADVPPPGWIAWSPDGTRLLVSAIGDNGWTAIVDVANGQVTRIDEALYNPRWSASGAYWEGQLLSGELLVFRADGTPHMRMNGVCAMLGSPWIGDEIATWGWGQDVSVAMDGSTRPYTPASFAGPFAYLASDGRVELLDHWPDGAVLAELRPEPGATFILNSEGITSITRDGRAMFSLGGGGKGFCENVGMFSVELLPRS
ncbi:MAG: hypothetical protein U0837_10710 [Dehalococcoidia bacterium]|jgi:hypothetical protein